jgi:hypothetical protein
MTGASAQKSLYREDTWVDVVVLKGQSRHRHLGDSGVGGFHVLPQHVRC